MDTEVYVAWASHMECVGGLMRIFIQRENECSVIVENYLQEHMKDFLSHRYMPKKEDLIKGVIAVGKFDDNQYHRIQVLDPLPKNNCVSVLFIDYGNHEFLPLSDIRVLNYDLHEELVSIPPLAMPCFLENVRLNIPWKEDEFSTLKNMLLFNERKCTVRQLSNNVKVVNVFLSACGRRLSDIILENRLGIIASDKEIVDLARQIIEPPSFENMLPQSPLNNFQIISQPLNIKESINTNRLLNKEFSYNWSSHMLPVNSTYHCRITHMEDGPLSFCVQLKLSYEDALPRLTFLLMQEKAVLNTCPLLPGSMVMTKGPGGDTLRRSIVMNVKRNFCQVYHMDYGSSDELPFSEIYQLPKEAQAASPMALNFCIADLKSIQVTDAIKAYFQDQFLGKEVLIKVTPPESEGPLLQYCEMYYKGRSVKEILQAFSSPLEYTNQHPPTAKDIKVTVSHVEGPSLFFIQYHNKQDVIRKIQEELQTWCRAQPRLNDLSALTIGTPVGSLFEDNIWYRGMVVGLKDNLAEILYVDFGNRNEVPPRNLCTISRDIVTRWRSQAVECCLQGFESESANETDEKLIEAMEDTINRTFSMSPISILSGFRYVVELVDEYGAKLSDTINQLKLSNSKALGGHSHRGSANIENTDGKQRTKNDNFFVRPSVRPLIEVHNKLNENENQFSTNVRADDNEKNFGVSTNLYKRPSLPAGMSSSEEDFPIANKLDDDTWERDPTKDSGSTWSPDHNLFKRDKGKPSNNRLDEKSDKNMRGGENEWSKRDSGTRFSEKCDNSEFERNRFSRPKSREEDNAGRRFGNRNRDDGGRGFDDSGNRFFRNRDDGDNRSNRYNRDRNREDGESPGKFGDRRRDFGDGGGEGGGNRYNRDRNREDGEIPGKFGDRRRDFGDGGGNRFGGRRREDGENNGGSRFGDRRRGDDDRRGGRFDGQGRRDGGRFNNNSDFKSKRFESNFDAPSSNDFTPSSAAESWDDDTCSTPAQTKPSAKATFFSSYPAQNITTNTEMQAMIASVVNPQFFYVQEAGCEPALDLLRTTIDSLTEKLQQIRGDCLSPGTPVIARFSEDELLYRGTVKYVIPPDQAHVLFIDYGNLETVSTSNLFTIPSELLSQPPLALHCSLSEVSPPNHMWPNGGYETLMNADEIFTMKVVTVKMIDGELVVSAKMTCSDGVLLSQKLIEAELAVSSEPSVSTALHQIPNEAPQPVSQDLPITPAEVTSDSLSSQDKWIDCMRLLLGQKLYVQSLEIMKEKTFVVKLLDANVVTLATLADHQVSSCIEPGANAIVSVDEVLEDRLKITLYDMDGVEIGPFSDETWEPRKISPVCPFPVVRSIDNILITHTEGTDIYIQRSADLDDISKLLEETFSFYENSVADDSQLSIGDLCCAKSLVDDNWYRAQIQSIDSTCTVRYLDYGNTEDIPIENLRKLDHKFIFAQFALKVSLPVDWISADPSLLDILPAEDITCKFRNENCQLIVDMSCSGKRFIDILIENNVAKEKDNNPFHEINSAIGSDLVAGITVPIIVSHADSPSMFWAHMLSHIEKVDELQEQLQAFIENALDAEESDSVFAAQYSADSVWYRATRVDNETLRFIDYGNTDALISPKKLSEDLIKPISGYAIPMYLCARPVGDDWSDDAIKEFELFIEQQNIVAYIVNADYKLVVDLCEDQKRLSDILIESGHAVYCDYVPSIVKTHLKNSSPLFFKQKIYSLQLDSENEQSGISNQAIEKSVSNEGPSSKMKVCVCHCNSFNDFYVQDLSRLAILDTVQTKMLDIENAQQAVDIQVGGLYGVKFVDDLWYRAKVRSLEPCIEVFLVDYGKPYTVSSSNLRVLPPDLISEEPFALHCSLGVDDYPDVYSKFVECFVKEQTPLLMSILSYENPNIVRLYTDDNTNVFTFFSKSLENSIIKKGKQKVFVTYVESPDCFYVQTESQLSKLEELLVQMSFAESFKQIDKFVIGDLIAVLFEDDSCWYRAEVLSFVPDIFVRFVDYGSCASVKEYRELPSDLKKHEFLVTKCALQLPKGIESWPDKSAEVLATTCTMNPEAFQIEFLSSSNETQIVELYLNGEAITDTLITMSSSITALADDVNANTSHEKPTPTKENEYKVERGYITHINSVSDFYIQKEDCAELLKQVEDGLSALPLNVTTKPDCQVGSIIAAKFVDGEWYRGEILQLNPEIRVRFIDYGNECNVSEISEIPENLSLIPPVAMKCSLDVLDRHLKDNAKELFHKHFGGPETVFDFTIKSVNDTVNIVEIILGDENVLSLLCLENSEPEVHEPTLVTSQDFAVDDTSSDLIGKHIKGFISHIHSVNDFFIQEESATNTLETIQSSLNEAVNSEKPPETCDIGDLISAEFTDGSWYRAEVIATKPNLKVRFIDYGNESVASEISSLTPQLLDLPAVALRCSLGMDDLSEEDETNKQFIDLFGNGSTLLDFHIVSSSKGLNIVNVLMDGEDICLKLKGVRSDSQTTEQNNDIDVQESELKFTNLVEEQTNHLSVGNDGNMEIQRNSEEDIDKEEVIEMHTEEDSVSGYNDETKTCIATDNLLIKSDIIASNLVEQQIGEEKVTEMHNQEDLISDPNTASSETIDVSNNHSCILNDVNVESQRNGELQIDKKEIVDINNQHASVSDPTVDTSGNFLVGDSSTSTNSGTITTNLVKQHANDNSGEIKKCGDLQIEEENMLATNLVKQLSSDNNTEIKRTDEDKIVKTNNQEDSFSEPISATSENITADDSLSVNSNIISDGQEISDISRTGSLDAEIIPEITSDIVLVVNSVTDFYLIQRNEELEMVEKILVESDLFDDPTGVNVDDILAGKSADNGRWYRCRVDEVSDGNYTVFLIDYGRQIKVTRLKELPNDLILLEPRALHCKLYCPENISHWPQGLTSIFSSLCHNMVSYNIIDDSDIPVVVALTTDQGDVSTLLAHHYKNFENNSKNFNNLSNSNEGGSLLILSDSKDNKLLSKSCMPVETKEETPTAVTEHVSDVSRAKKSEKESLPSKPIKSLAEIKANAKPKIVTRSQGSSPVDKNLFKKEPRSPSKQGMQEIHINEKLQRPLLVRCSSLDDKPVPGSISNPSSPSHSSPPFPASVNSSPRHSVSERIVPGSISGIVMDEQEN